MSLASALSAFRNLRLVGPCSKLPELQVQPRRWRNSEIDRKHLSDRKAKQELIGTTGESGLPIDIYQTKESELYPDADTPTKLFNGIPFRETPVVHITTSKNNTIMMIAHYDQVPVTYRSCGMEGFKNAKKGTNVAAQATAITLAKRAMELGIHSVRVKIDGLGPGRMASVKGLQMAGLKIISVTDSTHISWHPPRSKKQRRL